MILSIESSCDDSAIALTKIDSKKLLYHRSISQDAHSSYGGVVPELAGRLFARDLPILLNEAMQCNFNLQTNFKDCLKAIAVTTKPGLPISLLEGVMLAKSLCLSYNLPLISINHLKGHIYSLFLNKDIISPMSILLVSGGHSMILEFENYSKVKVISTTLDDSFGECYDKCSKVLNLGYPGGEIIDNLANDAIKNNIADDINFSIPLLSSKDLNFSFSGIKNAFRLKAQEFRNDKKNLDSNNDLSESIKQKLALALQNVSVKHLINKCRKYFMQNQIEHFAIVGGASKNTLLRKSLQRLCDAQNITLHLADIRFCADNAAMIGRAAIEKYNNKNFSDLNIDINSKVIDKKNIESIYL